MDHGSGLCPHSPAMALRPTSTLRSTAMPPPTPVPRITPKTTRAPAPAPSTASESAKQFASFSMRTTRPKARSRSSFSGRPMSQVELAFLTRPVSRESAPGMPIPTAPSPISRTSAATAATVPA